MAEVQENVTSLFDNLNVTLNKLSSVLSSQGAAHTIKSFGGNKREYNEWLKSVEKHAFLSNLDTIAVKKLAFKTATGAVSDFIQRRLNDNADETWSSLKRELSLRFGEITDPQYAFTLLKEVKQSKFQSVQEYAEKLISLASEAYAGTNISNEHLNRQIVGFFIDGLWSDSLKMKLLRDDPTDLGVAIDIAVKEDNLRRRFRLRIGGSDKQDVRREEPMDVDHARKRSIRCFQCGNTHDRKMPCPGRVNRVNVVGRGCSQSEELTSRPNNNRGRVDPRKCFHCGKLGHIRANCPQSASITCFKCRRMGHTRFNCPYPTSSQGN